MVYGFGFRVLILPSGHGMRGVAARAPWQARPHTRPRKRMRLRKHARLAALQVRGSETREELKGVRTRALRNAPVVFEAMRRTSVTCVSARAPRFQVNKRTGRRRASACCTANAGRGMAHCTAPGSDVPAIYSCLVCGPRCWRLPSKCARLRLR